MGVVETQARECESARQAESLASGTVYFETSAWNWLERQEDRDVLVARIRAASFTVLTSVIAAGELLRTKSTSRRSALSATMLAVLGERHLLEPPAPLAAAAARAFAAGEADVLLSQSGPGRTLLGLLHKPDEVEDGPLSLWLEHLKLNLRSFTSSIRQEQADHSGRYLLADTLAQDEFLVLLTNYPAAQDLGLALGQIRELCARTDVWRALAGVLGSVLTQGVSHSTGGKAPGGPDVWQMIYLGVTEVFVTSDKRLLKAAMAVSAVLRYPRCVVSTADFLDGIRSATIENDSATCRVCGGRLGTGMGVHAPLRDGPNA